MCVGSALHCWQEQMGRGSESNQRNLLGAGVLLQYEKKHYSWETGTSGFRSCTDSMCLRAVGLCWVSCPVEPVACGSDHPQVKPRSQEGHLQDLRLGPRGAFPGSLCDTRCIPLYAAAAAVTQLVAALCLFPARCSLRTRAARSLRPAFGCEGLW